MKLSDVVSLLQEQGVVLRVEGEYLRVLPPKSLTKEQVSTAVSLVRDYKPELLAYFASPSQADPLVCRAEVWLNKAGKPCGARETPYKRVPCANTTWIWSEGGPICFKCYTPRQIQPQPLQQEMSA